MNVHNDLEFADRIEAKPGPSEKLRFAWNSLVLGWSVVYLVNLVVPLFLGIVVTDRGDRAGRVAMGLAIPLWLGVGWWVASVYRKIGRALVIGGGIVAVSQFVPVFQIFAGSCALRVAGNANPGKIPFVESELGGFAATIITGGLLIGVALALGLPIVWFTTQGGREDDGPGKAA